MVRFFSLEDEKFSEFLGILLIFMVYKETGSECI